MVTLLWSIGCWPGPIPPCEDCVRFDDADQDGFTPADGDCNDADGTVFPGADERCNDTDDDCDGFIDDDAVDAFAVFPDGDGDGFGAGDPAFACALVPGLSVFDTDCDDTDPEIRPDAPEVCDDGIDNDCDGTAGPCARTGTHVLADADATFVEATPLAGLRTGATLAALGDAIFVGSPGEALAAGGLLRLRAPDPLTDATFDELTEGTVLSGVLLAGVGEQLALGPSGVVVQEETGVVVRTGFVHLFPTGFPDTAPPIGDGARVTLEGNALGRLLAMDDDGGLLLSTGEAGISARWVPEPGTGLVDVTTVGFTLGGPPISALALGDLDGDGDTDLVIANDQANDGFEFGVGQVWVFFGPVSADRDVSAPDRTYWGSLGNTRAGGTLAVLPDLDGNGRGELAVGAPAGDGAWLIDPNEPSGLIEDQSWLRLVGPAEARFATAFAAPDLDVDGQRELVVSAPGALGSGRVYVLSGAGLGPGVRGVKTAELELVGNVDGDLAGQALAVSDVDADGRDDLLVGAPGADAASGEVTIWKGRGR
ncbi:MAG: MopE-related protein [Myxococcota bacterium]